MVKESSLEEEPLERSLKKTMATPTVGCETARERKRLQLWKEGRRKQEKCDLWLGRKWGGEGVDILAVGQNFGNVEGNFARGAAGPFTLNDCVHRK